MPFMSHQTSVYDAVVNAGRLMKEGRANAVKLEGGVEFCTSHRGDREGIHSGCGAHRIDPQSVNAFGGFKVQGKMWRQQKKASG